MTNPYEAPAPAEERPGPQALDRAAQAHILGGTKMLVLIGVIVGLLIGLGIRYYATSEGVEESLGMMFVVPAVGCVLGNAAMFAMLKSASLGLGWRVLLTGLLSIPAYILFVPMCTFTSFVVDEVGGTEGMVVLSSSAVCFTGVLLIVAASLLGILRNRNPTR